MTSNASLPAYSDAGSQHVSKVEIDADQHIRLIQQAQHGNLEAFNELILIHQDSIFSQALWILNDEASAEEASQETFLVAFRKLQTFHGGSFRAWLLRITTDYCLHQIRAAQRLSPTSGDKNEFHSLKEPGNSKVAIERIETEDEILRCVQRLASRYRLVVILMDLQRLDYTEASAVLDMPVRTLKSCLSRARVRLHKNLLGRS